MKLKLLAPFQIDGFEVRSEMPVHDAPGYADFWGQVEAAYAEAVAPSKQKSPRDGSARRDSPGKAASSHERSQVDWLDKTEWVRFTHSTSFQGGAHSRYRSINADSLTRPLHVMEVYPRTSSLALSELFENVAEHSGEAERRDADNEEAKMSPDSLADPPLNTSGSREAKSVPADDFFKALAQRIGEQPPKVLIRVYDHGVSLIELDLDLGADLFRSSLERKALAALLDRMQQTAIEFTERLTAKCQEQILVPLFRWLPQACPLGAKRYLRGKAEPAVWAGLSRSVAGLGLEAGSEEEQAAEKLAGAPEDSPSKGSPTTVLWVSRALLFERTEGGQSKADGGQRTQIIKHWLKDVGEKRAGLEADDLSLQWLNYLFREKSYGKDYPQDGWSVASALAAQGSSGGAGQQARRQVPVRPFCPAWEAMINCEYYYSAFDLLQTRIRRVLARSFTPSSANRLRGLKKELDSIVKESNLLILDYQENFKYYRRSVHDHMKEILAHWNLESVLLEQVQEGVKACNERVTELHKKASARSSVYTDLILLAIGVTSVFSIFLGLLDYGRNLARDAALAAYERGSPFNFVDWIAAHSTDGILMVAAIVSGGLVALYIHYKRQQLL